MEQKSLLYITTNGSQGVIGIRRLVKIDGYSSVQTHQHLCCGSTTIDIPENNFEISYRNATDLFIHQKIALKEAQEQHKPLAFSIVHKEERYIILVNNDYHLFSFMLHISDCDNRTFRLLFKGYQTTLFVKDINGSQCHLSYYAEDSVPLNSSETPYKVVVENILTDRIVVSYEGHLYTIPQHHLFYANTPRGIGYYDGLKEKPLVVYSISRDRNGRRVLTDKRMPYYGLPLFRNNNRYKEGSVITGIPFAYNECRGIYVCIENTYTILPRLNMKNIDWCTVPDIYPLGKEASFIMANDGHRYFIKPDVLTFPIKPTEISDGLYLGQLFSIASDENTEKGESIILVSCMSVICTLPLLALPEELRPFAEGMVNLHLSLPLNVRKEENTYVCRWPTNLKESVSQGQHLFSAILQHGDYYLLQLGHYLAVHKITSIELFVLHSVLGFRKKRVDIGDWVSFYAEGHKIGPLLQVSLDNDTAWKSLSVAAGDIIVPTIGCHLPNSVEAVIWGGCVGIVMPYGAGASKLSNTPLTVIFVDKEAHQLVLAKSLDGMLAPKNIGNHNSMHSGAKFLYLERNCFAMKYGKQWALLVCTSIEADFLRIYLSHRLAWGISSSPDVIMEQVDNTEFFIGRLTGKLGKYDCSALLNGSKFFVTVTENRDNDYLFAELDPLPVLIPYKYFDYIPDYIKNGVKLEVKWHGEFSEKIERFVVLPVDYIDKSREEYEKNKGLLQLNWLHDWNPDNVLADMFVVSSSKDGQLILSGSYGYGMIDVRELGLPDGSVLDGYCQQGVQFSVKLSYTDEKGIPHMVLARPFPITHDWSELEKPSKIEAMAQKYLSSDSTLIGETNIKMCQPWYKGNLGIGDRLKAKVVAIEKSHLVVRWYSLYTEIRRHDAIPQPYYQLEELYEVGQSIDCFIDYYNPERHLVYFGVCFDKTTLIEAIDFQPGQMVEVEVVRGREDGVIVVRNGVRGFLCPESIKQPLNGFDSYFVSGQKLTANCVAIDTNHLHIMFKYNMQDQLKQDEEEVTECKIISAGYRCLKCNYHKKRVVVDTMDTPTWTFIGSPMVKIRKMFEDNMERFRLVEYQHTDVLTSEPLSGTVQRIVKNKGIVVNLDYGGIGYLYASDCDTLGGCHPNDFELNQHLDNIYCHFVHDISGIIRLTLQPCICEDVRATITVGDIVTFIIARVSQQALYGHVGQLFAILPRQQAGWKYSVCPDLELEQMFSVGMQIKAHVSKVGDWLELTLRKHSSKEYFDIQPGTVVTASITQVVNYGIEDAKYLMEWDDYRGLLPIKESSYQAFPPLLYLVGEKVKAVITHIDADTLLPVLSYRRCNPDPFCSMLPCEGDVCLASLIGITNGHVLVVLDNGVRLALTLRYTISTREQLNQLIEAGKFKIRITKATGRIWSGELELPYPKGTQLLRGTRVNITIFQAGYQGYNAFTDDGLLVWLPIKFTAVGQAVDSVSSLNIHEGDIFPAKIVSNPGDKVILVRLINQKMLLPAEDPTNRE